MLLDPPQGLTDAKWDGAAWNADDWNQFVIQFKALHVPKSSDPACDKVWSCPLVTYLTPRTYVDWEEQCCTKGPWGSPGFHVWCKVDHSNPGGQKFGSDCELIALAYWTVSELSDPRQETRFAFDGGEAILRQNFTLCPIEHKILTYDTGGIVNPTQKPVHDDENYRAPFVRFLRAFCVPGDTVFVGFAGSGSEVLACLKYGLNVVACELDTAQFDQLCVRVGSAFDALEASEKKARKTATSLLSAAAVLPEVERKQEASAHETVLAAAQIATDSANAVPLASTPAAQQFIAEFKNPQVATKCGDCQKDLVLEDVATNCNANCGAFICKACAANEEKPPKEDPRFGYCNSCLG